MDTENTTPVPETLNDEPDIAPATDSGQPAFMLTTAIRDRFEKAVWRKTPKVSPRCEMLIRPLPPEEIARISKKHSVCQLCGGRGFLMNMAGERYVCPQCKARGEASWTSLSVRVAFARRIIEGWRNMEAIDPETGQPEEVIFSADMRDLIANTMVLDVAWEEACELVTVTKQQQSKSAP